MPDRQRVGRFLRTLLGLLTVSWFVVAMLAPPYPFTFLLWIIPAWGLALAAALALELGDGYARLRQSRFYNTGGSASSATVVFVVLTVVLKASLTVVADVMFGTAAVGYREGVIASLLALGTSYAVIFWAGVLRPREEVEEEESGGT